MNNNFTWQTSSVADFFQKNNWLGNTSYTTNNIDSELNFSLQSWPSLIVEDFFAFNNWSGKVVYTQQTVSVRDQAKFIFDLTYSPQQFWQCFNWSGASSFSEPNKAQQVLQETEEILTEVEDFTLNDLSQLF